MEKNYTELNLSNEKKGGWLIPTMVTLLVVLIVVLAGALYLRYTNTQQASNSLQNFITPTIGITPTPTPGLDKQINNIDLGTDSADLNAIQKDINQL